jgi:hypothetical protein
MPCLNLIASIPNSSSPLSHAGAILLRHCAGKPRTEFHKQEVFRRIYTIRTHIYEIAKGAIDSPLPHNITTSRANRVTFISLFGKTPVHPCFFSTVIAWERGSVKRVEEKHIFWDFRSMYDGNNLWYHASSDWGLLRDFSFY